MYPCVHTLSSTRTGLHHAGVHALHEAAPHSIVSRVFSPVQVHFRGGHGLGSGGHGRGVGPNKAHVEEQLRPCWLHLYPLTQLHCIPPHHLLCMLQLGGLRRLQGRHASLRVLQHRALPFDCVSEKPCIAESSVCFSLKASSAYKSAQLQPLRAKHAMSCGGDIVAHFRTSPHSSTRRSTATKSYKDK